MQIKTIIDPTTLPKNGVEVKWTLKEHGTTNYYLFGRYEEECGFIEDDGSYCTPEKVATWEYVEMPFNAFKYGSYAKIRLKGSELHWVARYEYGYFLSVVTNKYIAFDELDTVEFLSEEDQEKYKKKYEATKEDFEDDAPAFTGTLKKLVESEYNRLIKIKEELNIETMNEAQFIEFALHLQNTVNGRVMLQAHLNTAKPVEE